MAVTIEDVPCWQMGKGVGHAVAWVDGGWTMWLCGTLITTDRTTTELPKRICRECRKRLKTAKPTQENQPC